MGDRPYTTGITSNEDNNGSDEQARGSELGARAITVNETADAAYLSVQPEYPTGAKFWLVMLTMGASLALASVDMNIVATAVPSITDHFHTVADVVGIRPRSGSAFAPSSSCSGRPTRFSPPSASSCSPTSFLS